MKTNKIIIAALGLLTLGGLASCSDSWLDVDSKTESNSGNFFKTQEDGYRALIGCYDGWQRTVSSGPSFTLFQLSETMSDECLGGTGNGDTRNTQIIDRFDMNQAPSYTDMHNSLWNLYYAAIFRCNEFIDKGEGIAWKDSVTKKTYLGEAHAIRAICYFDLARIFERVPLLLHATKENVPQVSPDTLYNQIVTDMQYAIDNIPANAYPKSDYATNDGHITKYAAEALMARIYLFYDGYYNNNQGGEVPGGLTKAKALADVEDVIGSGEYGLVTRFKDLWPASADNPSGDYKGHWVDNSTYAGVGNKETVLSMKFNYTADYNGNDDGNRFVVMVGMRTGGNKYDRYGQGWGAMTVNPNTVDAFKSGDQRESASIITCSDLSGYESNYISDQREYTGYALRKYTPLSKRNDKGDLVSYLEGDMAGDFQISQYQDWVLVRYSDVLLMAAELGSPNAQDYFDLVRQRAFTLDNGSISPGYSQITASRENIWNERRMEFVGEGIRYWDELRQGLTVAANQIAGTTKTLSAGSEDDVTIKAENIINKRGFCQIPRTQITLSNGVLKQNAGW